mmetsp:Transcript_43171/g.134922  ORF Transcript_43171/g.134922 Transcript_43171/m.134922 type:complete len:222 (+) Transcript_43171:359-1024(+)
MVVLEGEDQAFVPCDERHALGRCALAIGKMHISARCQQPHGAGDEVRLRVRLDRLFRLFDIRKRRTGHSQQRLHSRTVSHPWHTTTQYRQGATPMQVHGVDIRLVLDQNLQNVWAAACADGVAERRLERVLEEWQRGRLGLPRECCLDLLDVLLQDRPHQWRHRHRLPCMPWWTAARGTARSRGRRGVEPVPAHWAGVGTRPRWWRQRVPLPRGRRRALLG